MGARADPRRRARLGDTATSGTRSTRAASARTSTSGRPGARLRCAPLRAREDIGLIAQKILQRAGSSAMLENDALSTSAQPWPRNVRELRTCSCARPLAQENVVRRGDVAGEGEGFAARPRRNPSTCRARSPSRRTARSSASSAPTRAPDEARRGNLSAGAREADLARHHLRDLLKKRGLGRLARGRMIASGRSPLRSGRDRRRARRRRAGGHGGTAHADASEADVAQARELSSKP